MSGIPPTTQVASTRWHLSGADASLAFRYVDAYVWAGRPWLGSAGQFEGQRALGLAVSTPLEARVYPGRRGAKLGACSAESR